MLRRRTLLAASAAAAVASSAALVRGPGARAQAARPVRIGVLNDLSGPFQDIGGPGSSVAARMAIADFGGTVLGRPVEVLAGDMQNKPDVAAAIARRWFDTEGVDAITDLPVTPIAFAVQQVAKERQRTVMITAAATSDLTAKTCSPVSTHWAEDTHALTAGTARAVLAGGGTSWFFITVDHAFGHALQAEVEAVVRQQGGQVAGAVRHPIATSDFAGFLLQAQTSGAKVIGLCSVGLDLINAIKQASEFGLLRPGGPTIATFLTYISDIHSLGLPVTGGLQFAEAFYWDQDDKTRTWSSRFEAERRVKPTKNHAAIYACTLHYLKAMAQAGTSDAVAVNKAMRALPVDWFGKPASVRADGRVLFDLELYRVKRPDESRGPWDYYVPVRSIPAAEAFLPPNPACTAGA